LRVHYAKRGRLRFTSHRDFSRAFERALVRARIPMAYSSGFSPHPRISYAGASPTGAASEAEYLEIGLAETVDPQWLAAELDAALPEGLDVVRVVVAGPGSLADRLEASRWQIDLDAPATDVALALVESFLARESVPVERMTKKGLRTFDTRAAVLALTVSASGEGSRLDAVLRHTVPAVRPDDLLIGLARAATPDEAGPEATPGLTTGLTTRLMTRLEQGPLDEASGAIGDPLSA
jgi:radical SAM-linked protein